MINMCHRSLYAGLNRLSEPLGRQIISRSTGALGHRLVVVSDSRNFSEKLPEPIAQSSKTANIEKIGATAGKQRLVRIFSDYGPVKILGAGAATIAALKFAEIKGVIILTQGLPLLAAFWNITQGVPLISPTSMTFSGLLLMATKYLYDEGYESVMTDDLERASAADVSKELAIRQACFRAQVREALDVFGFVKYNTYFRLLYKRGHRCLDTLDYGEFERRNFRILRLDFQEPINRHDVAGALDSLGPGFTDHLFTITPTATGDTEDSANDTIKLDVIIYGPKKSTNDKS